MNYIAKRYIVKIPKNISIFYCDTNHVIIFANSFVQKVLILKTKLIIEKKKKNN